MSAYAHFLKRHFNPFGVGKPDTDLHGFTCIVTGANRGLGYATASYLVRLGASTVILAVRNLELGEQAKARLLKEHVSYKGEIKVWELDLASFDSSRGFTHKVSQLDDLHILVNNAGTSPFEWRRTADGWEERLQVNVISNGLVAHSAISRMAKTAEKPGNTFKPHLTLLTTMCHKEAKFSQRHAPKLLEALNDRGTWAAGYTGHAQCFYTTQALIIQIAQELSQIPAAMNITINSICPGFCATDLARGLPSYLQALGNSLAWRAEYGARSVVWAATHDTSPGAYIEDCVEVPAGDFVRSEEGGDIQQKIWQELVRLWVKIEPSSRLVEAVTA